MNFFPSENITYKTRLNKKEALVRLADVLEPKNYLRFGKAAARSYEGEVTDHTFRIQRIIYYRNSFLPRISGVIEEQAEGTLIRVKMRLHVFVLVFMCIWLGFAAIVFFALFFSALRRSQFTLEPVPLGMVVIGYVVCMLAFKYESSKAKQDLQKVFKAEIVPGTQTISA